MSVFRTHHVRKRERPPATRLRGAVLALLVSWSLSWLAFGISAAAEPAGAPRDAPSVFRRLNEDIEGGLASPQYRTLAAAEKESVFALAFWAAMLIDSGHCADPNAGPATAEQFMFAAPVALAKAREMPEGRRGELLDIAMDVESMRTGKGELATQLCPGDVLAGPAYIPLADRRTAARHVLELGLSPPETPPGETDTH